MGGGATDRIPARSPPRLERRSDSPPRLLPRRHGSEEQASPTIPDEILAEIFLRLPTPADLARAYAACATFRRVASDSSFLREYRKLHAPPLLGFFNDGRDFTPAVAPYPSASAASAVALAADFSFSFLPGTANSWVIRVSRDGRVLLDSANKRIAQQLFREIVVCDPLDRRYLLLPPIPDPLWWQLFRYSETFLAPSGGDDDEETSFRVISMVQWQTRLIAFVFSSCTGQWRAIPSHQTVSDLLLDGNLFLKRQYAYDCFYWMTASEEAMKMLVLDTGSMEFSIAESPPEAEWSRHYDVGMVEAGEGRPGMFLFSYDGDMSYTIRRNDDGSSSQWQLQKTISMGSSRYRFMSSSGKHLFLVEDRSYFSLDVKTFQLKKRVCDLKVGRSFCRWAYYNFPPLLSTPTVSSGTQEAHEQGVTGC